MEQIRVLHILHSMDRGGAENAIMNYYRYIDRETIQFDFLLTAPKHCAFEDEILAMGGRVFRVPLLTRSHPFKYMKALDSFFKEHPEYRICHSHTSSKSFFPLWIAKKNGVLHRICHSHNTAPKERKERKDSWLNDRIRSFLKIPLKWVATDWIACGESAAIWLYGKKALRDQRVRIVKNVIDAQKFDFNPETRKLVRNQLGLAENELVVGHFARFSHQKNHKYTIDVLKAIKEKNVCVKCLFVGDGELHLAIEQYAIEQGVIDLCVFTGVVTNVYDYMMAADVFVMPSFNEGLPLVVIEAQITGLECFLSDAIPEEVRIADLVRFLPLSKGAPEWADEILSIEIKERRSYLKEIQAAGYDALISARTLQDFYVNLDNNI